MTNQIEYKYTNLRLLDFDTKADAPGVISGYASVTNEIDDGGDIIAAGAYVDTLPQFLRSGFMAHSHDWNVSGVCGFPVEAREDSDGLFVKAQFHSTPDAQSVRVKASERMKAGLEVGLSIGYRPSATPEYIAADKYAAELPKYIKPERLAENLVKAQRFSRIRILPKVELREFSIVTSPMNKLAQATAVKSDEPDTKPETAPGSSPAAPKAEPGDDAKGYFESALLEREANEGLWRYYDALQSGLRQLRESVESGDEANPIGALRELLQGFANRVYADLAPLFQQQTEGEADAITLRGLTALSALIALKDISRGGMKFDDHSETVLAAVGEFATEGAVLADCLKDYGQRGHSIKELRTGERKVGREISAANRERMRGSCSKIKEAMTHMQMVHDDLTSLADPPEPKAEEPTGGPKAEPAAKLEPAEDYSAEARRLEAQIRKYRIEQLAAAA